MSKSKAKMEENPLRAAFFPGRNDPLNGRITILGTSGKVFGFEELDEDNINITVRPEKARIISGLSNEYRVDVVDVSVDAQGRTIWLVRKADGKHQIVFDFSEDTSVATWAEFPM